MPYIYLLNETQLQYSGKLIRNSIVVFDEGHNVEGAAC